MVWTGEGLEKELEIELSSARVKPLSVEVVHMENWDRREVNRHEKGVIYWSEL